MSKNNWEKIGKARRSGVLVGLFSVYSRDSLGIGDFEDLKLLIDWCVKTGNSVLQLLPMNEVGATFCPYDAISSFALEPAYIAPRILKRAKDSTVKAEISSINKKFPKTKARVDYAVKKEKDRLLRDMYNGEKTADPKEFEKFIEENAYWLDNFALFKTLKYYHKGAPWYEWGAAYRDRDADALELFREVHGEEIRFEKWLQWIAQKQFRDVKKYAAAKNVFICGDLPILISRDSADVWAHREYFKLDFAAGAPPDVYCAKGQRWGVPTYNWEKIASGGYGYLKEKLRYAENFYDMLRVDHVVGLFRIWSIPYNDPAENEGLNGSFDPADEKVWGEHGRAILSVMCENTSMLLLAEDLGIIPEICPQTLKEFGIPGNDVQRWRKDWVVKHDFLEPKDYRVLSVSMLSTHDTTNWPAWWENEAGTVDEDLFMRKCRDRGIDFTEARKKLFDPRLSKHGRLRWFDNIASSETLVSILGKKAEELKDFVELYDNTYREKEKLWKHLNLKGDMTEKSNPEILKAVLNVTQSANSLFCIELLIDYLYLTDIFKGDPYLYRINRPGTVSKENWSLVIPVSLEGLLKDEVCKEIKAMIRSAGRFNSLR